VEAVRPSLFTKAVSISRSDPWVLATSAGTMRLAPLRTMSSHDRRSLPEESVLFDLTELGHIDRSCGGDSPTSAAIPLRPEVILLLPWSVVPTLARLGQLARGSPAGDWAPDEDWLPTWHHFVDDKDTRPAAMALAMTRRAHALDFLLSPGSRRYVFGTVRSDRHKCGAGDLELASINGGRNVSAGERDSSVSGMVIPNPRGAAAPCPLCVGSSHAVRR
jgi:hypothetical protein